MQINPMKVLKLLGVWIGSAALLGMFHTARYYSQPYLIVSPAINFELSKLDIFWFSFREGLFIMALPIVFLWFVGLLVDFSERVRK